jgi:hypothetical protein
MVVVSLDAAAKFAPARGRKRAICGNDHDQARRDNRKPKQALS